MFLALSKFLQFLINAVGLLLNGLVLIFPPSPFKFIMNSSYSDLIAKINYFLPIAEMVAITEAWLVAVGVYYLYSVYARFIKAIE
ncbi:MAG: hypothetical protein Q4A75_04320 [Peptostreptococcaceae bacterium]|nr:hypothetical protein [Peptostreptococcaceae bacterium]